MVQDEMQQQNEWVTVNILSQFMPELEHSICMRATLDVKRRQLTQASYKHPSTSLYKEFLVMGSMNDEELDREHDAFWVAE